MEAGNSRNESDSEALRQYVELAIELSRETTSHETRLTEAADEGNVQVGLVDPSTFKKTG